MPILPLALPTQSNQASDAHGGVAALINCYAVEVGEEQKSRLVVRSAPGLDGMATPAVSGGVRKLFEIDGNALAVIGRTLHQVDPGGSTVLLGGIPSDGHVGMARNQRGTGAQAVVVCDGLSWAVVGGSQTRITDPDLPPAIDVCVINRRAIFASADGRMIASDVDDVTSLDGLDLAVAEAAPDGLLRVIDRGSDLIAMGQRSTEVWTDTGAELFGFARNTVLNTGLVGASAATKATVLARGGAASDVVVWAGNNHEGAFAGVFALLGFSAQKISSDWVDRKIAALSDRSSLFASAWIERGRGFVSLRLPDTTIVWDTSTWLHHERQSRDTFGLPTTWRIGPTTTLTGRVLAGDYTSSKLYWMDAAYHDEDGEEMIVSVRTPPIHSHPGSVEISRVYLDVVPGVGLGTGAAQDIDPVIAMRLSRDGKTWGTSRTRALGTQGAVMTSVDWSRLGTHPQASLEFSSSANVVREFYGARWEGKILPP